MKIYLVTKGHYSDYKVLCTCSSLEKAAEAVRIYETENKIEEHELDSFPKVPFGFRCFMIIMTKEGTVSFSCREEADSENHSMTALKEMCFNVWAKDEQHAIKIANELRIQLIANGEWS